MTVVARTLIARLLCQSVVAATPCGNVAERKLEYGCVHEHVTATLACGPCHDHARAVIDSGQGFCRTCLDAAGEAAHECRLVVTDDRPAWQPVGLASGAVRVAEL